MHYLGSKARHAREIIAITTANRKPAQIYVEPFVGGGNVINKVPQGAGRVANDKNFGMVALLDSLGNHGWVPPETMTEAIWRAIMKLDITKLDREERALFAFAATGPTFGSVWMGPWVNDESCGFPAGTRYRQARDSALSDAPGLAGIVFRSGSYDQLEIPDGSLVYCDPPYSGDAQASSKRAYGGSVTAIKVGESNHNLWKPSQFWKWCDGLVVNKGCTVFVSEYNGPLDTTFGAKPTPEMLAEKAAAYAARKALNVEDPGITNQQIEELNARVFAIDDLIKSTGAAYAAKWHVVWEKEVATDISFVKSDEEAVGKRETEKLFTRTPG